jgi:hypothetical protein
MSYFLFYSDCLTPDDSICWERALVLNGLSHNGLSHNANMFVNILCLIRLTPLAMELSSDVARISNQGLQGGLKHPRRGLR